MTDRPDDRTQPISTSSTSEQPAVFADVAAAGADVPTLDAAAPAAAGPGPSWASTVNDGDIAASVRPVPVTGAPTASGAYGPAPVAAVAPAAPTKPGWRERAGSGRGLAVAALVVGLGLGAVGGAAVTYAATADRGGSVADGTGGFGHDGDARFDRDGDGGRGFDRDGDGDFGPPDGYGPPPGGQLPDGQAPGGGPQQGGGQGQLPGGTGDGSDANGTSPST